MDLLNPANAAFWERAGAALICGAIVGIERRLRGKAIGLRTSVLIVLGTQFYVTLGLALGDAAGTDRTRILGQIVTGIGFLGAGVIMNRGESVEGLTTAATIWVLAACGACIGFGYLEAAIVLALLTLAILRGLGIVEGWLVERQRSDREA